MKQKRQTYLIDILHPAHVHFFRNLVIWLQKEGHRVIITARDKEISIELLESYGLDYILISKQQSGFGLILEMVMRTFRLARICRKERPDLLMGIMGPSIAVAGFCLRIPAWVFYDTENAWITNWFAYPLAKKVYTPNCYLGKQRTNESRYPGYHELAYLHPALFAPDKAVVVKNGITPDKPYVVVRFVGWQASHDAGEQGLAVAQKIALVNLLARHAAVFISSESPLPDALQPYRLRASIQDIHHILAFARLVVGESATMASEAAVLGVKAIFISDTKRGYTLEQEKLYGLVGNFSNSQLPEVLAVIAQELQDPAALAKTRSAHQRLLEERINVTAFIAAEIKSRSDGTPCAV